MGSNIEGTSRAQGSVQIDGGRGLFIEKGRSKYSGKQKEGKGE